jgi:choloylglycine hydrolase
VIVPTKLLGKYFLDNAATVSEAIALAQKFDVQPSTLPDEDATQLAKTLDIDKNTLGDINLHLFIQDEKGDAAVFDYLDERLVIHSGESLPILVLTNNSYSDSCSFLKRLREFGGQEDLPGTFDSLPRFAKAAFALKVMPQSESKLGAVSNLFIALAYAQNPCPPTLWTAVFDLSSKTMYLRSIDNQQIRIVRLNKFDISEGKPSMFLSINNDLSGYVESEFTVLNKQL